MFSSKPLHVACVTQTLLIYQCYELVKTSEYGVCVYELHSTAFHNRIMLYRINAQLSATITQPHIAI